MNENINNSINFTLINYKNIMSGGSNNDILLPSQNNYTLYIKNECPFCIKILELFNTKFPEYTKIIINKGDKYKNNKKNTEKVYIIDVLNNGYDINEFKKKINEYNKDKECKIHYTFPMLYKNGELIGGLDDFQNLLNNKKGGGDIKKNKIYKIIKL